MPYKIVKQKCTQSSGYKGDWVIKKLSDDSVVSCHKTKQMAQKAIAAIHLHEDEAMLNEVIINVINSILKNE